MRSISDRFGLVETIRKFRRWMVKNLVAVVDDNDETDGRKWEKAGRNSSIVVLEALLSPL
jgi:hypothetical protein